MLDISNSIPKDVLTDELKNEIERQFNESVEVKAIEIAKDEIELEKQKLIEEYDKKFDDLQESIITKLDSYLNEVIDEHINTICESLDKNITNEKTNAIINVFENLFKIAGKDLSTVLNENSNNSQYEELCEKFDDMAEKYMKLKNENISLKKSKIISEMSENLSLVESDKFKKLANLLEFDDTFKSKLETLVENIKTKPLENDKQEINETANDKNDSPSWMRFL